MNQYRFSDLNVGHEEGFNVKVEEKMLERFVNICADTNPLHVDAKYARKKGFPGQVVHGLLTSSFYSTLAGVHLPGKYALLHGIDIQFKKPVFLGDTLLVHGKVTYYESGFQTDGDKGKYQKRGQHYSIQSQNKGGIP